MSGYSYSAPGVGTSTQDDINNSYYSYGVGKYFYHGDGGVYCNSITVNTTRSSSADSNIIVNGISFKTHQYGNDGYAIYMNVYILDGNNNWQEISVTSNEYKNNRPIVAGKVTGDSGKIDYNLTSTEDKSIYWPSSDNISIKFSGDCQASASSCCWHTKDGWPDSARDLIVSATVPEYSSYTPPSIACTNYTQIAKADVTNAFNVKYNTTKGTDNIVATKVELWDKDTGLSYDNYIWGEYYKEPVSAQTKSYNKNYTIKTRFLFIWENIG